MSIRIQYIYVSSLEEKTNYCATLEQVCRLQEFSSPNESIFFPSMFYYSMGLFILICKIVTGVYTKNNLINATTCIPM